jgi:hypothetical protein
MDNIKQTFSMFYVVFLNILFFDISPLFGAHLQNNFLQFLVQHCVKLVTGEVLFYAMICFLISFVVRENATCHLFLPHLIL